MMKPKKKPWLAGLLSFLVVGMGQIYNKKYKEGILLFILGVTSYIFFYMTLIYYWLYLVLIPIWIYAIFDAYTNAKMTVTKEPYKNAIWITVIILVIFFSGVFWSRFWAAFYSIQYGNYTITPEETIEPEKQAEIHAIIKKAEPYINKIIFEDMNIRKLAISIVKECSSGDKERQINKLYRYIVENFNYYSDPRYRGFIQTPYETIEIKGGDCEDLTILLNSLLENIGFKTYIVLTEDHAYSLACNVNTSKLWKYVENSLLEQVTKDWGFLEKKEDKTFVLKSFNAYYYGGNGTKFENSAIEYMNISYNIKSSKPLTLYVVPSREDYELFVDGKTFKHYPDCKEENILRYEGYCDYLIKYGGIVLYNNNREDATIDLKLIFRFQPSFYKLFENQTIAFYKINDQRCIVLDPTVGKYGYPGYDAEVLGEKIAIDPVTKKYIYLK